MTQEQVQELFPAVKLKPVESAGNVRVLALQRFRAVAGPDYVQDTLYLRFVDGTLSAWKITDDTVTVVPLTW